MYLCTLKPKKKEIKNINCENPLKTFLFRHPKNVGPSLHKNAKKYSYSIIRTQKNIPIPLYYTICITLKFALFQLSGNVVSRVAL